jgi:hypothetical protein
MRVGSRESGFLLLASLGLALVTSLPYALGHLLPFPDSRFNENLVFDIDMNFYFALARQSAAGDWLFYNSMTPEPHAPVFFNLEWLLLGKLAAVMGGSVELAFQIVRIGSIFALCLAVYWLCAFLFDTIPMRRIAFTAIMLGGGFGWVVHVPGLGGLLPDRLFLDLSAAIHPFFWMLLAPHSAIAASLALLALCLFLSAEAGGGERGYWLAAAACFFGGLVRPYEMLYLVVAIPLYSLALAVRKKNAGPASRYLLRSLLVCASIPVFAYYLWLFEFHDVFRWIGIQSVVAPPLPGSLVLSLGLASVLLVSGLGNLLRLTERSSPHLLIACCFIASLGLLYAFPLLAFSLQFLGTLLIPMVLVGSVTLEPRVVSWVERGRRARVAIAAVLLLNSLTSIALLGSHSQAVARGEHRTDWRLIEAYAWLEENSSPRDVVLASCRIGHQIPRYTHASSFCGYFFGTVDFRGKRAMVQKFFAAETKDGYRRRLLRQFDVRYVVFSATDPPSTGYDPETTPFLRRAYGNDIATVFEVVRGTGVSRGHSSPHAAQ